MALETLGDLGLFVALCPMLVLSARRGEMTGPLGWSLWVVIGVFGVGLLLVMRRRNRFYRDVPEA